MIYRQEIVAFILYRNELQVWSEMCVSSVEFSLRHQVRIRRRWCRWIHRTPQGEHLIYKQEIVAFKLYRSELQVWLKMSVSPGEVFSGPSSPQKGMWCHWIHRTTQGDHLIYRQEVVAFILYRSELQVVRKCVFRLERSSLGHQVRIRGGWCHWIHRTP